MGDGFLGRWSRRKLEASEGKLADESAPDAPSARVPEDEQGATPEPLAPEAAQQQADAADAGAPVPTLEDVKALTPESDFSRFAGRNVAPDVKNAAMRMLFTDPRYNVMDGLDVYVGDYSRADPIAPGQLRQLASARFLGLFRQEEREDEAGGARDVADNPDGQSVAHCDPAPRAVPAQSRHADPDLRLQQDHAAPGEDPGHGAG